MPFAFDLTAHLPRVDRLLGDPAVLSLTYRGRSIVVSGLDGEALVESGWVRFHGGGFDDQDEAERFALELKGHLRLAAARGKFGIAIDDAINRSLTASQADERTGAVRNVHAVGDGVHTYEESERDEFVWALPGAFRRQYPSELLNEHLDAVAELDAVTDDRQSLALACDLLAGVDFDSSTRARFIRLVTALEALVDETAHSDMLIALVSRCEEELATINADDVREGELDSFEGQLRHLRNESIGRQLSALVERHAPGEDNGEQNERFVRRCYQVRSVMLHDGREGDAGARVARLRSIVERVILSVAASDD
jgi:hypothetical protein